MRRRSLLSSDPYNGHNYVDLDLPSGTRWATMNIGATSMTDIGNYYQYGKGSAQYAATSGDSDYSGTEEPLATSADTAAQVWGGRWHMPTLTQLVELTAKTDFTWTTIDGVNGGKFTSRTDNTKYVFLPAGGYYNSEGINLVGSYASYWSSTPSRVSNSAYRMWFRYSYKTTGGTDNNYGYLVRAVIG